MNITVLGAAGGTGMQVVQQAPQTDASAPQEF